MNNGVHEGDLFTWTNGTGSDVSSGDIVAVDGVLYVATVDIADTATGVIRTNYAVKAPKVSAAVIAAGETVIWDTSAGAFDDNAATPATGDISGAAARAVAAGTAAETTIDVKLTGVQGTVA
jgi:predicted RecA/RadA family phage recombinase